MTRTLAILAIILFGVVSTAYALYSVSLTGDWPKDWPQELESLRKQSRTLVGPDVESHHYAIPFTKREEMETAWPHLLKVKTKGAPIFLVRGPNFFLDQAKAGVVVHAPPARRATDPEWGGVPVPGQSNPRMAWMNATYIELVVDGEIVDLNRLPLPADAQIVDERFKEVPKK